MSASIPFSRGFRGRPRPAAAAGRLPPGQYETRDFSRTFGGSTPRVSLEALQEHLRAFGCLSMGSRREPLAALMWTSKATVRLPSPAAIS